MVRDAQRVGVYLIQTTIDVHILTPQGYWVFGTCLLRISASDPANDPYCLTQLLTSSQCFCILSTCSVTILVTEPYSLQYTADADKTARQMDCDVEC